MTSIDWSFFMIEITLSLVIVSLIGLIAWLDYNQRKERKSLLNAIMAKNTNDLVNLNLADKTEIKAKAGQQPDSGLVDYATISDDEAINLITNQMDVDEEAVNNE